MKLAALFSFFLLPFLSLAALHAEEFEMHGHGTLVAGVPAGWTAAGTVNAGRGQTEAGYTVTFTGPEELNARAMVTCLYVMGDEPSQEGAELFLKKNAAQFVDGSVEKKISPQPFALQPGQGYGSYTIFTDPKLVGQPAKKGDTKYMASGIIQSSPEILIVVTLFCDDVQGKEFKTLLEIIHSLVIHKPGKGPTI